MVPEGWTVASPLVEKDGWYEIGGYRAALTAQMLNGSCIGVGPFVGVTRTIGSTEYRVFSYGEWTTRCAHVWRPALTPYSNGSTTTWAST